MSSCQISASSGGAAIGSVARSIDVPAIVPVDHEYLMGVLLHRRSIHPTHPVLPRRRIESRLAIELLLHGSGFPVHRAGIVRERFAARPVDVFVVQVLLADHAGIAGSRYGHASQVVRADGSCSRLQNRTGIDVPWWKLLRRRLLDTDKQEKQNPGFGRHSEGILG